MNVLRQTSNRHPLRAAAGRLLARAATVLALAGAAVVAGCGGGTSQVEVFVPGRLVVLGEESSVLDDSLATGKARKYAVNYYDSTAAAVDCAQLVIVPQWIAIHYGLVFKECRAASSTAAVTAFNHAVAGARLEDPLTGLAAQLARAGTLQSSDLFTVWFGVNDIVDIYRRLAAGLLTQEQAYAEAARLGKVAAGLINDRLLGAGAHALVLTAPDVGLSPYAIARTTSADPDSPYPGGAADPSAVTHLSELSTQFNGNLRVGIDPQRFDGRNFGLVFPDEAVQAIHANPSNFGIYLFPPYNVAEAVCSVGLTGCTNSQDSAGVNNGGMVAGATYNTHLWAGDRWLGYPAHYLLGTQAVSRVSTLPF